MKGRDLIKKHEGLRLKPYKCTAGKLTIGYGRNIEDRGITEEEAGFLLDNDIKIASNDANKIFKSFYDISEARRWVLINMSLNLGKSRLSGFKKFIAAVDDGNFQLAAKEMLDSAWAKQVTSRALELANIMQRGEF